MELPGKFDHPALKTAIGTVFGYGVILVVMTTLLFLIPFVLFSAL